MNKDEVGFLRSREEHLRNLILDTEKDLTNMEVQEAIYLEESINPKHMGKEKAMDNLGIYQQRIRFLKENLIVYRSYAEAKGFKI